jgi:transposase-like protein
MFRGRHGPTRPAKLTVPRRRKAFLRKWRLKCPAVATSLEEADGRLFAFLRLPQSRWKSARTTNAVERLHEEFKRRIKTQTVPPSAETAAMLFWALLASGRITMRKVDGWHTLAEKPAAVPLEPRRLTGANLTVPEARRSGHFHTTRAGTSCKWPESVNHFGSLQEPSP